MDRSGGGCILPGTGRLAYLGVVLLTGCSSMRTEVVRGTGWEYRVSNAAWSTNVPAVRLAAAWPKHWRTYTRGLDEAGTPPRSDDPASFAKVPTAVTLNGVSACRASLPLYARGVLDVTIGQGMPQPGLWAYAFGEVKSDREQDVDIHVRACGPLTLWIGGKKMFQTGEAGLHRFRAHLAKGPQVLAARIESGADRWDVSGCILPAAAALTIEARYVFTTDGFDSPAAVIFSGAYADRVNLNGRRLAEVLPGMNRRLAELPMRQLRRGRNVLTQELSVDEVRREMPGGSVSGLRHDEVRVLWGPVITSARQKRVTWVCRLNASARAVLRVDGREFVSPPGAIHRWRVDGLKPGTAYPYSIVPGEGVPAEGTARTLSTGDRAVIAIAGDPQSGSPWRQVATNVEKAKADIVVIAGDLVVDGLAEEQWTQTCFAPAAHLLANCQSAVVRGNHDRLSPVLDFLMDGAGPNWAREVGGALLVGIDGGLDWSPGSTAATWLEGVLAGTRKPFVFVITHYPAYSSRNHGKLAGDGRVLERTSRVARKHIVSLLEKHSVTALFAGHDHGYERSETPGGLTAIVTGGAGAGVYPKRADAAKQNPYSKAFAAKHHYCLLRIDSDAAVLTAVTPAGDVLDTRTWGPRETRR